MKNNCIIKFNNKIVLNCKKTNPNEMIPIDKNIEYITDSTILSNILKPYVLLDYIINSMTHINNKAVKKT